MPQGNKNRNDVFSGCIGHHLMALYHKKTGSTIFAEKYDFINFVGYTAIPITCSLIVAMNS